MTFRLVRKRHSLVIAAAAVLLMGSLVVGLPASAEAATTRTLTITGATAHPTVAFQKFDGNPPKLFDINGDGKLEIIAQNDNQWVYVFDSKNGNLLFEAKTTFPSAGWGARSFNGPEVAIMNQDGKVRLIVANSASFITSYRFEPAGSSASKFIFAKEWERRLDDCYAGAGMDAKPVLADLDKDGRFEILGATEQQGLYALRDDGALYWKNCLGGGNAEPTVADVNLDGWPDVVHVSDGGVVALLNGRTGGWMWGYKVLANFDLGSASMPVGPAVGQLDGKGGLDIVVGVRDSHDDVDYSQNHAMLLALDSGGKLLWARQDPTGAPLTYTHAIIGDAAKDGTNEVYWGDWNTMGHKPPFEPNEAFKQFGAGSFFRYDHNGTLVWKQTLGTFWSNKDVPIADVTGDGVQDMLANGPNANGRDGIWYLNTRTGAKQEFVDAWPYKVSRAPVVADLWNTGTTQWVVQVVPYGPSSADGIHVYDTGVPYNALWPHLPYPTLGPAPPPTPSEAPGVKEAEEFATKTAGGRQTSSLASRGAFWNQWSNGYLEDHLKGDGASKLVVVARGTPANGVWPTMIVTVDGGSARTFTVSSPNFTEYRSAPPTAGVHKIRVAFTNDLRTATEDRNVHLDVVRAVAAGSTPGGGTFTATFTPKAVGNDWWVATTVNASEAVTRVDARLNGGTWTELPRTQWDWAKSLHAPDGTKVEFRATGSSGATVTSSVYIWT